MMDPVGIAQRIRWMLLYRQRVVMQVFRGRQQMFRHLDHLVLQGCGRDGLVLNERVLRDRIERLRIQRLQQLRKSQL